MGIEHRSAFAREQIPDPDLSILRSRGKSEPSNGLVSVALLLIIRVSLLLAVLAIPRRDSGLLVARLSAELEEVKCADQNVWSAECVGDISSSDIPDLGDAVCCAGRKECAGLVDSHDKNWSGVWLKCAE